MALPNHSRTAVVLALLVATAVATGAAAVPAAAVPLDDDGTPVEISDGAPVETSDETLDGATNDTLDAEASGTLDAGVESTTDASLDDANATTATTAEADTGDDLETGAEPLLNASVAASADATDGDLSLDADVDTAAGDVEAGVAADASTDGDAAGAQGEGASDDESADESDGADAAATAGSDGGPSPEDVGAGVAVGSLLLGGGLLARRGGTLALLSGGAGASPLSAAIGLLKAWGWRLAALAGYQRWDDSDPLEHEGRAAIYDHLEASPGDYLSEIAEETGVALSTLRYHLRILEFEGLVTAVEVRGKRRFFPADVDPDALATALEDEATAAVLEALARDPDSVSGLADRLDRDPSTVSHHLQRLEDEGLVERERDGRSVVNRIADGIAAEVVAATDGRAASSAD